MTPSPTDNSCQEAEFDQMMEDARQAADFLKALGHEGRLMILCSLAQNGEMSPTDFEKFLRQRQSAVSQQLARLRLEGLVETERNGKTIKYRLADDRAREVVELVYQLFCSHKSPTEPAETEADAEKAST